MKTKTMPSKLFEIMVPIKETWVFRVMANSKEHALELFESDSNLVNQTCTTSGWPNRRQKIVVTAINETKGEI